MDCRLQRLGAILAVGTGGSHRTVFPLDLKPCPIRKASSSSRGVRTNIVSSLFRLHDYLSGTLCAFYSAISLI